MTQPTATDRRTAHRTVTVPIEPPRNPAQYRATQHFKNRLRERADDAHRSTLPRTLIQDGAVHRAPAPTDDVPAHERGAVVAFTATGPRDQPWTLIAGLRPTAFADPDERHRAITIYQGPAPDADASTAQGGRDE